MSPSRWQTWSLVLLTLAVLGAPVLVEGRSARAQARLPDPTEVEVVRQSDPEGCGAALLATLLARHGLPGSEADLLAAAPPDADGITLATFAALARDHGLTGVWRRRGTSDLPAPGFVAHLHRPRGHFVFVEARAGDYLHVLDPATGAAAWHVDMFTARWSGRYLRLEPAT